MASADFSDTTLFGHYGQPPNWSPTGVGLIFGHYGVIETG